MADYDMMYEADVLAALDAVDNAWDNFELYSPAERTNHLEQLAAVMERKSDYATFSESTNLTQESTCIH